jgi:hypothetical protein
MNIAGSSYSQEAKRSMSQQRAHPILPAVPTAGVAKPTERTPLDSAPKGKILTEAELRMVVELVSEMARKVASPLSTQARALTLARASLKDPALKTTLTLLHRNIMVRRKTDPNQMLAPLAPLFKKLELEAQKVLSQPAR